MQSFQKDLEKLKALNAQVIGISPDSLETHRKFSEKYGFEFPLVADEKGAIRKLYLPGRITFLVDKGGIIRYIYEGMPRIDDFLGELKKLEGR